MYLADGQLSQIRLLIRDLFAEPFSAKSVQETGQRICSLLDADYFGLNIYPREKIRRRMIISNNPAQFIQIYRSIAKEDFLLDSIISTGSEYTLSRSPNYDQPKNKTFIQIVQSMRPISDMIYIPLKANSRIRGHFSLARAGLKSPLYTDQQLEIFRFLMGFVNDAFQCSFVPPPPEEDVAYLDYDGNIVEAGARIKEIFNDFFGRDMVDGAKRNHSGASDHFLKAYKRFLHGPLDAGMNKVSLENTAKQYLFIFKPMKNGSAIRYSGFPYASVRFLETSLVSPGVRSAEQAGEIGHFEFSRREHEVLEGIFKGRTNKEIAQALGIDESTVKRYTHNIYEKTGFRSRVELVLGLPGA